MFGCGDVGGFRMGGVILCCFYVVEVVVVVRCVDALLVSECLVSECLVSERLMSGLSTEPKMLCSVLSLIRTRQPLLYTTHLAATLPPLPPAFHAHRRRCRPEPPRGVRGLHARD